MAIRRNILQYGKMFESEKYLYGKGSDKINVFFFSIIANKTAVKFDCYGNVNVDVSVRPGTLKCSPIKYRKILGGCWKLFNFKSLGVSTQTLPPPPPPIPKHK